MLKKIIVIGERGIVGQKLKERLVEIGEYEVYLVSTDVILSPHFRNPYGISDSDLIVMCVEELRSQEVYQKLPSGKKILDISPTFRCNREWVYGLPEIYDEELIKHNSKVANPGCFATSAILLLQPVLNLYPHYKSQTFYLDGVGGYTTGGRKMIADYESGKVIENSYSLNKEHLHIKEIKKHAGVTGDIIFTPKVGNFPQGIRMQIFIPVMLNVILKNIYKDAYGKSANVIIEDHNNFDTNKISADEMVGTGKVTIRVYQKGSGCIAVSTMDNLGKGAIDSALQNIELMLAG